MKTVRVFLGLAAFAVAVFLACSSEFKPECDGEDGEECTIESDDSSQSESYSSGTSTQASSPSGGTSSSATSTGVSSSTPATSSPSVSNSSSSPGTPATSSSSATAARSSSSAAPAGPTCGYQTSYCGGIALADIKTISITGEAPEGPACLFATAISKLGNENGQGGGLRVNGTKLVGNWNSDVGGRCGNTDWGQQTCAEALKSVTKVDGGYYIYVPAWAGDFATTGGSPTCSVTPQPQPSSASTQPSSSSTARSSSSTGTVSPSSASPGGTSSAAGSISLTCGTVPTTGTEGQSIAAPTITCNGSTVTGTAITWSGSPSAPNWNNPVANTYTNIRASVTTGTCSGRQVACSGTLTVNPGARPSSASTGGTDVPRLDVLNNSNAKTGTTTRYWDACKPSCAWTGNAGGSPNGAAKSCSIAGAKLSNSNEANACDGGGSFACMDQAPWKVTDDIAYGFAATTTNGDCGKCFQLQFTSNGYGSSGTITGKNMIVMVSNIGGDVHQGQFDIMIPGGGVGQFNALTRQIQNNGGSSSNLGATYGGFRSTCGNSTSCVSQMCSSAFGSSGLSGLKSGCDWYVDWFKIADNPAILYKEITCPAALVNRYKN